MKSANIDSTGRIMGITSCEVEGFPSVPDDAKIGDYFRDGKTYPPPNNYSILASIKDGAPIWTEDAEAQNAEADVLRRAAYREESDPIFFKEQRGEVEPGTWSAKVAEIKAKYPKISA